MSQSACHGDQISGPESLGRMELDAANVRKMRCVDAISFKGMRFMIKRIATDRTLAVLSSAPGRGARPAAAVAAALNDGYSRAFEVATALTAAAFLASFVVPAIRSRRSPSSDSADQHAESSPDPNHASGAGVPEVTQP